MSTNNDHFIHCLLRPDPGILTRMRQIFLLATVLLSTAAPALAQVTIDLHALDALPGAKPPTHEATPHRAAPRPTSRPLATAKREKTSPQQATAAQTPAAQTTTPPTSMTTATSSTPSVSATTPPPATLPNAAPPAVALAPVAPPPPAAEAAPPPPPPISAGSNSSATVTSGGLRVAFGSGEADLSQASADAIHSLVKNAPAGDNTSFNVVAYAAGTPEDPSTARRLSLSRALAVRSALIADGVNSARIYVRALGAAEGDQTPDRVELAVLGGNAPAAVPANAQGQVSAPAKNQTQ
jgi:outer membrane protein OmpA-like peptidoglycan-associated protein